LRIALVEAQSLGVAELAALFREGFSDYEVPLALDDAEFAEHLAQNDIDLACSRVAVADRPVSLALIARRADQAWVGGMATVPAYRRQLATRGALRYANVPPDDRFARALDALGAHREASQFELRLTLPAASSMP
jgi:hypothetical protein